jgi:phage tail sheath gpL-like
MKFNFDFEAFWKQLVRSFNNERGQISFNSIPSDQLVPFVYVEFDNRRAVQGPGVKSYKALLVGNRSSGGSVAQNIPTKITNADQAGEFFGRGSQLADMAKAWFDNNKTTEVHAIGIDDDGTAASGDFTLSGSATEAGEVAFYIGGERIGVAVESGDTAAEVMTALETKLALNKYADLPIDYSKSSGTMNIGVKNEGAFGNEFDLRVSYFEGEKIPNGLSMVVTQPSGGAGNPDNADAIAALSDDQWDVIVLGYNDASNMALWEAELVSRFGPLTQNDGTVITFKDDTFANLSTYGDARNSPHSVVAGLNSCPTAPWRVAASIGANVAFYAQIDPARPFQTLQLKGVLAPAESDRFTQAERNLLLGDGIATLRPTNDGLVLIERLVTTYKTNSQGADDVSYRDLNTLKTLSFIRWDLRNYILRKYPNSKLADDGTRYNVGQAIVTPSVLKAEIIMRFSEWEAQGLVEGVGQFKADLVVERNVSDPNRLDVLLPPDLVNQFRVAAVQIQFLL